MAHGDDTSAPAFARGDLINVIIETPAGSRIKYHWQPELRLFKAAKFLAAGSCFPYDVGFIPSTQVVGGEPLDVLVLSDGALAVGCLVECRVLGAFEVETSDRPGGEAARNVRLIAVPEPSLRGRSWQRLGDLGESMLDELADFLRTYVEREGRSFDLRGQVGPQKALQMVRQART